MSNSRAKGLAKVCLRRYFASSVSVATQSKQSVNLKFWGRHLHLIKKRNLVMAQEPLVGQDLLICRGFTITLGHRTLSRTLLEEWSARRIPGNSQDSQETDIHAAGSIRTRNPIMRTAVDWRFRMRGHWSMFKIIPERKRSVGKPRKRWLDDAENDLKKRGVKRRRKIIRDRNAWKLNLKVAKVQQGL